ncbi:NAD(P)H-dependent oxidoreductase [Pseudomonas sp. PDM14]|uniref:FMN-dependent NADH-azoreductase n=1 Tax=Pseudomonas sp. PDM14 TaxID=2769288 RepID=UPI001780349A|nr:NAD(P)H-dependent oxidoreductase [Pseudomonas sp. PDM14]MBD9482496.1 NAD(P)H-dependent oxidoreductase [Pseudomonas sp. PDM14]
MTSTPPGSTPLHVLRLIGSPRGADSESLRLSQQVIEGLAAQAGGRAINLLDYDLNQLAHVDAPYALALGSATASSNGQDGDALCRSDALIDALDAADVLLIATPMHNYTVPSALKAWIDHVVRVRVTFTPTPQGKVGVLRDRPVYVAISSGGLISGESARQPDFLRPYLRVALGTVGLHDLQFFTVEGTARGEDALEEARALAGRAITAFFSLG